MSRSARLAVPSSSKLPNSRLLRGLLLAWDQVDLRDPTVFLVLVVPMAHLVLLDPLALMDQEVPTCRLTWVVVCPPWVWMDDPGILTDRQVLTAPMVPTDLQAHMVLMDHQAPMVPTDHQAHTAPMDLLCEVLLTVPQVLTAVPR